MITFFNRETPPPAEVWYVSDDIARQPRKIRPEAWEGFHGQGPDADPATFTPSMVRTGRATYSVSCCHLTEAEAWAAYSRLTEATANRILDHYMAAMRKVDAARRAIIEATGQETAGTPG